MTKVSSVRSDAGRARVRRKSAKQVFSLGVTNFERRSMVKAASIKYVVAQRARSFIFGHGDACTPCCEFSPRCSHVRLKLPLARRRSIVSKSQLGVCSVHHSQSVLRLEKRGFENRTVRRGHMQLPSAQLPQFPPVHVKTVSPVVY